MVFRQAKSRPDDSDRRTPETCGMTSIIVFQLVSLTSDHFRFLLTAFLKFARNVSLSEKTKSSAKVGQKAPSLTGTVICLKLVAQICPIFPSNLFFDSSVKVERQ